MGCKRKRGVTIAQCKLVYAYCISLNFHEHFIFAQIRESARFANNKCTRKFSASPELSKTVNTGIRILNREIVQLSTFWCDNGLPRYGIKT